MTLQINIKRIIAALILTLLTAMAITTIYHTAANRTAAVSTMQWSADTCRWGDGWMRLEIQP